MKRESIPLGEAGREVAKRLRIAREKAGLTQQDLALRTGRPFGTNAIGQMEMGNRRVDVDDLVALADALGCSLLWLLGREDCTTCSNTPPHGFTCQTCGREGEPV